MNKQRRIISPLLTASVFLSLVAIDPLYGGEPERPSAHSTVRLIIPGPPGTTYDRYGRLLARHLGRHLPGDPIIVPQNMPGASGQVAANYLYNVATKDGSVVGLVLKGLPMMQALGERAAYDIARFNWIGSPARLGETLVVWHTAPARAIEDARRQPISLGATTPSGGHYTMPRLANELLGTRFKIVTGYTPPQINLAMERGEVEGRASEPWSEWKAIKPEWVRDRKIVPLIQMGLRKHGELPDVSLIADLPMGATARAIFDMTSITSEISRPLAAPPGVPTPRVAQWRQAFRAAMTDPALLADAAKIGAEINPISDEELAVLVRRVLDAPKDVTELLKTALAAKVPQ